MQCDDVEREFHSPPHFDELDSALHELGMLSTYTDARREYLSERRTKDVLNMLTINTRYVSNVSIGFRVRPVTPHARYKPYSILGREERLRTKSENNDGVEGSSTSLVQAILEDSIKNFDDLAHLKKAKSLDSIVGDSSDVDFSKIKFPEVEIVSSYIEKLKVE